MGNVLGELEAIEPIGGGLGAGNAGGHWGGPRVCRVRGILAH